MPLVFTLSVFSFLALTSLSLAAIPPSSVASTQLQFWSKNVQGVMPESLLSKLSPLSEHDSDSFASLVSKKSVASDAHFCSLANLDCSSKYSNTLQVEDKPKKIKIKSKQVYNAYSGVSTPLDFEQADSNSFFRQKVLRTGNQVQLPDLQDQFPRRAFLPSEIASMISIKLDDLQILFSESFASPETNDAIQTTLSYCDAPTLKGEIKSCPKSLEDMIEFSKKVLGKSQLAALTSSSAEGSGKKVVIGNIKQFRAQKIVSCHEVYLPFATYFCHLLSSTHLYAVDLMEQETRAPVDRILAICHMDTSAWPKNHLAFKILKSSPGKTDACHWMTKIDLVWIRDEDDIM